MSVPRSHSQYYQQLETTEDLVDLESKNDLTLQNLICEKTTCRMTSIMISVTRNYKYIFYSALLVVINQFAVAKPHIMPKATDGNKVKGSLLGLSLHFTFLNVDWHHI